MKSRNLFRTAAVATIVVVLFIGTALQAKELPPVQQTKTPAVSENVQSLKKPSEALTNIRAIVQSIFWSWAATFPGSPPVYLPDSGGLGSTLLPSDGGDNGCIKWKRPDVRKKEEISWINIKGHMPQ